MTKEKWLPKLTSNDQTSVKYSVVSYDRGINGELSRTKRSICIGPLGKDITNFLERFWLFCVQTH